MSQHRHHPADGLERCLDAWRSKPSDQSGALSATARANILRQARIERSEERPKSWFAGLPLPRWAFAAAAPTLAVAVLAGVWSLSVPPAEVGADASGTIEMTHEIKVSKVGDAIVFQIENGATVHEIRKSTSPQSFDERTSVSTESGAYSDTINNGVALTFYRID